MVGSEDCLQSLHSAQEPLHLVQLGFSPILPEIWWLLRLLLNARTSRRVIGKSSWCMNHNSLLGNYIVWWLLPSQRGTDSERLRWDFTWCKTRLPPLGEGEIWQMGRSVGEEAQVRPWCGSRWSMRGQRQLDAHWAAEWTQGPFHPERWENQGWGEGGVQEEILYAQLALFSTNSQSLSGGREEPDLETWRPVSKR